MESDPLQVRAQGSRVPLWPWPLLRGARVLSGVVGTGGAGFVDVDADHTPPFTSHLVYPAIPYRGKQDGCGCVGLGKEEGSRPCDACRCGCPSGIFPPGWRWVGGVGNICSAVISICGCETCRHAYPGARRGCWSGAYSSS